jgi:hypothetical protein
MLWKKFLLSKLTSVEFNRKVVAEMEPNKSDEYKYGLCDRPFYFRYEKKCKFCTKYLCQSETISTQKDAQLVALIEKYLVSDDLKEQAEKLAEEQLQKTKKINLAEYFDQLEEKGHDIDGFISSLKEKKTKIKDEKDVDQKKKAPTFSKIGHRATIPNIMKNMKQNMKR